MALSEKDNILIEKHLSGQLTSDEHQQFAVRMDDPLFVDELAMQNDIKKATQSLERDDLRVLMQHEEEKFSPPVRSFASQRYRRILGWSAAAVLLLISLFLFLLPNISHDPNEGLYAQYYEPFPNIISPITKGEAADINGYHAYESAQYQQAIDLLESQPESSHATRFYLAQSYLALGDRNNAQDLLEGLVDEDSEFKIPARWYLALIHLSKGENTVTLRLLEEVSQSTHPLAARAKKLLADLK